MKSPLFLCAASALLAGGCSDIPDDTRGTLDRVKSERQFRVGVIASPGGVAAPNRALVARVAAATGARPRLEADAAEPLLVRLGEGDLDLVVGEFERKGPWSSHVHMLPSLASRRVANREVATGAAAANGENRWIMLVDREARALGGKP
ncbi:MAG TPA: hypothetical protein VGB79_12435 [Allosphingosinicella sp.]|jgi:hypothetical protein